MPSIDQHPPPETLVAYHERRLSDQEAEDVREHLVACRDCTAQLLGLADLLDGDGVSVADEISRSDLDAAWQRQRERLLPLAPVAPLRDRKSGTPPPSRRSWVTAASLGLAAALALVVVGQWRTIDQLKQPQANPSLVNLEPVDSVRAGSPVVRELKFTEGTERGWVILNPAEEPGSSPYDIEIVAADGEVVLGFQNLQGSEVGNFRLEIPRAALEPGDYTVRLVRAAEGRRQVEEFKLKVTL